MPFGIIIKKWLGDLLEVRSQQIKYNNYQLDKLSNMTNECPKDIIDFLIMNHKINQSRTETLSNINPMDIRETFQEHLDNIQIDIEKLDLVISSHNPCKKLTELNKERMDENG